MTTRSLFIDTSQDPGLQHVAKSEVAAVMTTAREVYGKPDTKNVVINTNIETTKVYVKETFNLPGGSNSQIQINQNGQFLGDSGLTYNAQTDTLRTGSLIVTDNLTLSGTADFGSTLTGYATESYVLDQINIEIANLINSAPGALDTLGEIATTIETLQNDVNNLNQFDQSLNTTDSPTFNEIQVGNVIQNFVKTHTSGYTTCAPNANTVIYTGTWGTSLAGIRMSILVEGNIDGDTSGHHTQMCDAIVSARYLNDSEPVMTVYALTYTTPSQFATFSVRRNAQQQIEVLAFNTNTSENLHTKVHAVDFGSYYD